MSDAPGNIRRFGRRDNAPAPSVPVSGASGNPGTPASSASTGPRPTTPPVSRVSAPAMAMLDAKSEALRIRTQMREKLFQEILDVVPLKELYGMPVPQARVELSDVSKQLLNRGSYNVDISEQESIIQEIINDILGFGPLESLLERDDIADIMVCGPNKIFIEIGGKLRLTDIRFRNEEQLRNVASRIVQAVGRRVDESSPICDARLKDGSRVAIVIPPIAIDGTCITIRKFKKDKLQLDDLVKFNSITKEGAKLLEIISACRLNVLVSGGTGSGKSLSHDSGLLSYGGTWIRMGDVAIGDVLMAPDGKPAPVCGIYPQGILSAFLVKMADGTDVRCSEDHLWKSRFNGEERIATTGEIRKSLNKGIIVELPYMRSLRQQYHSNSISKVNAGVIENSQLWSKLMNRGNYSDEIVLPGLTAPEWLNVSSVDNDGECEMQCIMVAHPDHLFITDHYIVTHNTTLLNCLTRFIDPEESIITCEDAAELQLQQPNVRRWETKTANLEGVGEIPMAALVKASLRHRPERIIIGEVRGPEAFDLLQAMNTGHDGSAGTVHSNSPREAVSRLESLIAMGGFNLPAAQVREQIVNSIDVIIQASRLRDGSRKITFITELVGMEGDKPQLQDLLKLETMNEGLDGKLETRHVMTGIRPTFWDKARYYGREKELAAVIESSRNNRT